MNKIYLIWRLDWDYMENREPIRRSVLGYARDPVERDQILACLRSLETGAKTCRGKEGGWSGADTTYPKFEAQEVEQLRSEVEGDEKILALTVDTIQRTVAEHFDVKVLDLKGSKRHRVVANPRMVSMYLARKLTGMSYPEIGAQHGGKDHTTVINAFQKIENLRCNDINVRFHLDVLERRLSLAAPVFGEGCRVMDEDKTTIPVSSREASKSSFETKDLESLKMISRTIRMLEINIENIQSSLTDTSMLLAAMKRVVDGV